MKKKILRYYDNNGYTLTMDYIVILNKMGKLSLKERGELEDLVAHMEIQPKRNKTRSK